MSAKGQTFPLLHTVKARQRVVAGISWDERAKRTTIIDRIRGTDQQHDLDISCFVYDEAGTYIDFVGPMAQDSMDQSGCIYHSGDDATGEGSGDDEFISCELAGLPADVHSLFFVTEIRSNHVFSEVDEPCLRIADGMSNKDLFTLRMAEREHGDKKACVMVRLFRDESSQTGWSLHHIDDYPNLDDVPDWGSWLARYLKR